MNIYSNSKQTLLTFTTYTLGMQAFENTVTKGEYADKQHFSFFLHVFYPFKDKSRSLSFVQFSKHNALSFWTHLIFKEQILQ